MALILPICKDGVIMGNLIDILKNDKEVLELREQYHQITGKWLGFHWDCFGDIDEYKEYMRDFIKKHTTSQQ